MGQPAYIVLEEFHSEALQPAPTLLGLRQKPVEQHRSQDLVALRVQEAYANGYADGELAERAAGVERLAALESDHEQRIERIRRDLGEALTEKLRGDISAGLDRVQSAIESRLLAMLIPVFKKALTESVIRELAVELSQVLDQAGSLSIQVSGPENVIAVVMEALAARRGADDDAAERINVAIADQPEVRVEYGQTVIETRLMEWLSRLEEARGS